MHLVVELRHPLADVAFEGVDLQIAIFDEDDLADHRVLPAELVVVDGIQEERCLALAILGIDDEPLWLRSAVPLLEEPLGVVVEMAVDASFNGVTNDRQGVALLLRPIAVQFGHDVVLVTLERGGGVLGVFFLLVLVAHQLTFFLHDVAEQVLDDRSLFLFGLLLLGLVGGHQQVVMGVQLLQLLLGWHLLQVVVQDAFLLLVLEVVDVLVQNGLELLDVVQVDLKVNESMAESGLAVRELQVELGVLEGCLLDLQDFVNDLLV